MEKRDFGSGNEKERDRKDGIWRATVNAAEKTFMPSQQVYRIQAQYQDQYIYNSIEQST